MSHLLDTHALVWWFLDDPRLSTRASALLEDQETKIHVSAASAWDLATKRRIGKLREAEVVADRLPELVRRCRFVPLAVSIEHAHRAGLLSGDHKDPFDRMLVAQALAEGMTLISADPALAGLGAPVVW